MKKYIIYARKSSETEDRQVLSIESQLRELETVAKRLSLNIIDTIFESQSAKIVGRKRFDELLTRIKQGEANSILTWHPDRLSRNSQDSGDIIALIDNDILQSVQTPTQRFENNPMDKFMLGFFMMQAKFENDHKGENVKVGLKTKAEKGWYPAPATTGYLNTPSEQKGFRTIEIDKIRFPLVRKAFDEVLSGKQAIQVWREIKEKRILLGRSGKPISRSAFYYILTNPFYYGDFEWPKESGTWYQGKHTPLVTKEEFDIVQRMLGKYGRPIARRHTFDLTGLLRCSECGCSITGSIKTKYYKGTNRTAKYSYYHCTHKNTEHKCNQPPITQSDLNIEISELLLKIRLKPEFIDWAKRWLKELHQKESVVEHSNLQQQNEALEKIEKRLSTLLDMRLDDKIDSEIYENKKKEFEQDKAIIKLRLEQTDNSLTNQRIKIENALDFAYSAYTKFNTGTREEKHEVMIRLGSNLLMDNKKVRINLKEYLEVCSGQENWKDKYKDWIEPQEYTELLAKRPDLRPAIPNWLPR